MPLAGNKYGNEIASKFALTFQVWKMNINFMVGMKIIEVTIKFNIFQPAL